MNLQEIYEPIADELKSVEYLLELFVRESENLRILSIGDSLLESPGKRLRPALVILSEKAAVGNKTDKCDRDELVKLAAAVELIHLASLVHDDVLDGAAMRHSKPSINARFGDDIAIVFGDYVYSKAFELIGECRNPDVFECMCQALHVMCQGELTQICQRGNLSFSTDSYITIVRKKTASLFAASCHAATLIGKHTRKVQMVLRNFGMNFGIAFQIVDDLRDIVSKEKAMGKKPGQDMLAGDITLPLLNLFENTSRDNRKKISCALKEADEKTLDEIREMFINSDALDLTRKTALHYIESAQGELNCLENSDYKESLECLTKYIIQKIF